MRIGLVVIMMLFLGSCAIFGPPTELDDTKGLSAERIYEKASERMASKDYKKSVEYLKKLESRYPNSKYGAQAKLDMAYAYYKQQELQLALEYDGKFAGALSFHTLNLEEAKAEIGYWVTADIRGKGIATQATKLLTEYGFETIGFHRIEALVVESNKPSLKVLSNAGYQQEGVLRDACCQDDGTRENMIMFAAIRTDWEA